MWALCAVLGILVPFVCALAVAEWILRAGERRRVRAAREGAQRTTLGARWVDHQDRREAARELRDGRA